MQPIIPSWIFYVIDALGALESMAGTISFLSVLALIVCLVVSGFAIGFLKKDLNNRSSWCESDIDDALKVITKFAKGVKMSITIFAISVLVAILIPSKETMYTMLVNQYITTDNIETAGNTAKEIVDYIFDKVEGAKE